MRYNHASFSKSGLVVIFLVYGHFAALSQYHSGSLKGQVVDKESKPIDFATIALRKLPDSTLVTGKVSDEEGRFFFEKIAVGNYYTEAVNVGYQKAKSGTIVISAEQPNAEITLLMQEEIYQTGEIIVTAQKPVVRQEAGITIIEVENSPMNAGISVSEALKRVPGVTVDKDRNVKLKGKDGVLIMVDDKPLYMEADQVANFLKSLSADQVKSIEAMSTPPAKYDAAGNAGIIHIRLKKGANEGLDGTANTSYTQGFYAKYNAGVQLSYKKGKWNLNGGYQYNKRKGVEWSLLERRYSGFKDSSYFTQSRYVDSKEMHNATFNGSLEATPRTNLHWNALLSHSDSKWLGASRSTVSTPDGQIASAFKSNDIAAEHNPNWQIGLGHKHRFDSLGTELSTDVNLNNNRKAGQQTLQTLYEPLIGQATEAPSTYWANNPILTTQADAKIDLVKIQGNATKWESGIKWVRVETQTDNNSSLSGKNKFRYTEQILAAYTSLGSTFGRWKLQVGLRLEHTQNEGVQYVSNTTFKRAYANLFPNLNITFQQTEKTSLTLLYSRRIERPNYEMLNPFSWYSDPYTRFSGNPYLGPQYTQLGELVLSNWQGALLSTLNYSYSTQPFADAILFDANSLTSTWTTLNLISNENMGISLAHNMPLFHGWTTSNYVYFYRNQLKGDVGYGMVTVERFAWEGNTTQTFSLGKGISAELTGIYESPRYYGTVLYRETWQLSAGVQKRLWNDKLSAKIALADIFYKFTYLGKGEFGEVRTSDSYRWDNRVLTFSLSYRIGRNTITKEPQQEIFNNGAGTMKR